MLGKIIGISLLAGAVAGGIVWFGWSLAENIRALGRADTAGDDEAQEGGDKARGKAK
ncbi:MAG: hypothetical protein KJ052_03955 [Candidatus Hydrogenedentes bacterium]|nr:hypothetical protein [Candidatus Hydrogenedentota bacterium]